ncbi:hypothetical protein GR7B_00196 [Vibrio phage vB_VcorM_GR7B]|nr:hypothetical protein GR7B_00196 [Vibrio phage vB_VcorM_GR7B]
MQNLGKLTVEDMVYYKHAELDLDYEGVTYLSGRNLNSKVKGRNNGSGKSLLMSPIVNMIKAVLPSHEKNARALKHSLFSTGTNVSLEYNNGKHSYLLNKSMPKKGIKWNISEDGKELNHPTPTKAENFAQSLCPLNEQEFFSTVYLDSRRPNTMHIGTSSERFNFFSDLFRLHDYDNIKKYFSTRIKELEEARVKRDSYIEQMADVAYTTKFDPKTKRNMIKVAEESSKKLQESIDKLTSEVNYIRLFLANEKSLGKVEGTSAAELKTHLKQWKEDLKHAKKYEKYLEKLDEYNDKLTKLKDILKRCSKEGKKHGAKTPKELAAFIKENEKKVATLEQRRKELKKEISKSADKLGDIETNLEAITKLEHRIAKHKTLDKSGKYEARIEAAEQHVDAIEEFLDGKSSGTCSVCGGEFTKKQAKAKLKELRVTIEKNRDLLKLARKQEKDLDEKKSYGKTSLDELQKKAEKLTKDCKAYKKERESLVLPDVNLESLDELCSKWKHYQKMLDDLTKPEKVAESVASVNTLEKSIDKAKSKLQILETLDNMLEDINRGRKLCKGKPAKKAAKSRKAEIATLQDEIGKLSNSITQWHTEITKYETDNDLFKKLDKKRRKIEESLSDLEIFDAMVDAYGTKGLKVLAMKNIKAFIEKNLNKYSSLLFPEKFEFYINVEINAFDIMVKRHSNGKLVESDVRHLSGSESRSFCLLWLISILPLIPQERRYNVCILDEYESNCDHVTREMMCKEFIPALAEIVPHVIFISPYADIPIDHPHLRHLVVEKGKDGISRLKSRGE